MSEITPKQFQDACKRTECDYHKHRMDGGASYFTHGAMGIVKEGGELLDLLEKWIFFGHNFDKVKFEEELGDVLYYCAMTANALNVDMGVVMERNIAKLYKRYPEEFDAELAKHRHTTAEHPTPTASHSLVQCVHCLGRGQVTCEWDTVTETPCPVCHGTGLIPGGFLPEGTAKRKTEPCCECGEDYPAEDLQNPPYHIYCPKCRCSADGKYEHIWQLIQTIPGSGRKCKRCGKQEGY